MTLTVTSLVLIALALTLIAYAPRARSLAAAAVLFAVSLALPVHAPTLVAGGALVATETALVPEAYGLLAAAVAGLVAIALPDALPAVAGGVAVALLVALSRRALRTKPRASGVLDLAARGAVVVAVAAECFPGHRLAALARVAALTLAASLGFTTLIAHANARAAGALRRHRAAVERNARRRSLSPRSPSAEDGPARAHSDDLALALRRIVHELRQPIGAASNALATGGLAGTDPSTASALRELAASELQGALASLEVLARFARVTAGDPVDLPAVDAVEIALGRHAGTVALDRSFTGTMAVDPAPLGHALDALVQNAHDASPTTTPVVSLRDSEQPGFVVLTVSDQGPAPSAQALRDAAAPFSTTHAGRLGLGASLAARYATSMGGRFELRRDGERTLAELHLPRKRTPCPATAPVRHDP